MIRKEVNTLIYKYFLGIDSMIPDIEFGFWPQTIRRWLDEGLPQGLTDDWSLSILSKQDIEDMFNPKIRDFFGFDSTGRVILPRTHINPAFERKTLERKEKSIIEIAFNGIICEKYLNDQDESSIPHYLQFPVEDRKDWDRMKMRFSLTDPTRKYPESEISEIRTAISAGEMIELSLIGIYGQLRNWLGFEKLSYLLYDDEKLILDMLEHWSDLIVNQIERLPEDIPIDYVSWWEDMAGKNGPFINPELFDKLFVPFYKKIMKSAKKRGCLLSMVDCDGDPSVLVPYWVECGINVMFPLEVAAGVDPVSWREKYGGELLLRGGIDKRKIAEGGEILERELERITPIVESGGYVPHIDHLIDPNISYENFLTYLEKKREIIGRQR